MVRRVVHFPPVAALEAPAFGAGEVNVFIVGLVVDVVELAAPAQGGGGDGRQFSADAEAGLGVIIQVQFGPQVQHRLEDGGSQQAEARFVALRKINVGGPGFLRIQGPPEHRQVKHRETVQPQHRIGAEHALLGRNGQLAYGKSIVRVGIVAAGNGGVFQGFFAADGRNFFGGNNAQRGVFRADALGAEIFGGVVDGHVVAAQHAALAVFHGHGAYGSDLGVGLVQRDVLARNGAFLPSAVFG